LRSLSKVNGAQIVVDHLLRGWRLMKKKKNIAKSVGEVGMSELQAQVCVGEVGIGGGF